MNTLHRRLAGLLLAVLLAGACDDDSTKPVIEPPPAQAQWSDVSRNLHMTSVVMFADGRGVAVALRGNVFVRSSDGTWSPGPGIEPFGATVWEGAWGSAFDDVFVVGEGGMVGHFDGARWTVQHGPVDRTLHGVWGAAANDVYAVGDEGTIIHFDGNVWTVMTSGTQRDLFGVHGSSAAQVFAVGNVGAFLEYDGSGWTSEARGSKHLRDVYAPSDSEVYVVGLGNRMARRTGGVWGSVASGYGDSWYAIDGRSASDLFVCGLMGTIVHFDGTSWTRSRVLDGSGVYEMAAGGTSVAAVGFHSRIMELEAAEWVTKHEALVPAFGLVDVWVSDGGDIVTNDVVRLWHVDATAGAATSSPGSGVYSIWGAAQDDIYAVGDVILHFGGASWTEQPSPVTGLRAVGGTGANDVLAAGRDVVHNDGSGWTVIESPAGPSFNAVEAIDYQTYILGGNDGALWLSTVVDWHEFDSGTDANINAVWGSSLSDIYAAGDDATLLHYDGSDWTPIDTGFPGYIFHGVWGRSAGDVYVTGGWFDLDHVVPPRALVLHYDGSEWRSLVSEQGRLFGSVSGNHDDVIFVQGPDILRYGSRR